MSELRHQFTDDCYTFYAGKDATIEYTRIRDGRDDGIRAEVEIRWNIRPVAGLLKHGSLNLLADRSIKSWSNELSERIPDHDWYATLTAATYETIKRYRQGDPPIRLADVDPSIRPRWLIRPLIEFEGPTVVAADGGSVKSLVALAIGLTVATGRSGILGIKPTVTGPVLYLDWEADEYAQRNRLAAICHAAGIEVPDNFYYRREYAALHQSSDVLARYAVDLGAVMVIIDSKGMAISGDSDKAEPTRQLFSAARKMRAGTLIVDHVTNEGAKKGTDRPFGSAYNRNIARNVWMAKKELSEPGLATVTWKQVKENNGPAGRRLSWQIGFDMANDDRYQSIRMKPVSPVEVAALNPVGGSTHDLIRSELAKAAGPVTVQELSVLLDIPQGTIRARLNDGRADNEFANVATSGVGKWTLGADYLDTGSLPVPF